MIININVMLKGFFLVKFKKYADIFGIGVYRVSPRTLKSLNLRALES